MHLKFWNFYMMYVLWNYFKKWYSWNFLLWTQSSISFYSFWMNQRTHRQKIVWYILFSFLNWKEKITKVKRDLFILDCKRDSDKKLFCRKNAWGWGVGEKNRKKVFIGKQKVDHQRQGTFFQKLYTLGPY
jgi:hypothetical protein